MQLFCLYQPEPNFCVLNIGRRPLLYHYSSCLSAVQFNKIIGQQMVVLTFHWWSLSFYTALKGNYPNSLLAKKLFFPYMVHRPNVGSSTTGPQFPCFSYYSSMSGHSPSNSFLPSTGGRAFKTCCRLYNHTGLGEYLFKANF